MRERRGTLSVTDLLRAEAAKKASRETVKTPLVAAIPKEDPKKEPRAIHSLNPIFSIKGVSIRIPSLTSHFYQNSHEFQARDGRMVRVENHYAVLCGIPGCPGSIIQRNYFGFRECEIGKNRVAKIRAWNKISKQGKSIILLDIIKAWGTVAKFALRFVSEAPWDIPAPRGGGIRFVPLQPPE